MPVAFKSTVTKSHEQLNNLFVNYTTTLTRCLNESVDKSDKKKLNRQEGTVFGIITIPIYRTRRRNNII